jgi:site-specific DNA recombinase
VSATADDKTFFNVRCAVYTRQSVARDGGDPALASCKVQRAKCVEFIQSMAWRGWYAIPDRFDDEGASGATTERPGLEKLLRQIENGKIQRVIVYRLDRLTRRLADWAKLAEVFDRHSVGLTVVHGAIDAEAGSLQRFQLNMLASFAEMERDMIAERLADARRARNARGERSSGRVPLGYASDPRTKQLVIVPDEARTVQWLFKTAASGKSSSEIAVAANTRRLPNKSGKTGTWTPRTVLRILQNPVYVARRPDGTPAAHAGIIAPDVAEKAASLIESRRSREPAKRASKVHDLKDPFLLRGLLICDECRKPMTTAMGRGKVTARSAAKAPRYYRCRTLGCSTGQVAAATVESIVDPKLHAHRSVFLPGVREKLRELHERWPLLWPGLRRRALAATFERIAWRARTSQVIVKLRPEAANDDSEGDEGTELGAADG